MICVKFGALVLTSSTASLKSISSGLAVESYFPKKRAFSRRTSTSAWTTRAALPVTLSANDSVLENRDSMSSFPQIRSRTCFAFSWWRLPVILPGVSRIHNSIKSTHVIPDECIIEYIISFFSLLVLPMKSLCG